MGVLIGFLGGCLRLEIATGGMHAGNFRVVAWRWFAR